MISSKIWKAFSIQEDWLRTNLLRSAARVRIISNLKYCKHTDIIPKVHECKIKLSDTQNELQIYLNQITKVSIPLRITNISIPWSKLLKCRGIVVNLKLNLNKYKAQIKAHARHVYPIQKSGHLQKQIKIQSSTIANMTNIRHEDQRSQLTIIGFPKLGKIID